MEQAYFNNPAQSFEQSASEKAVDYAISHLIEREAGFHIDELFEHAGRDLRVAAHLRQVHRGRSHGLAGCSLEKCSDASSDRPFECE